MRRDDVSQLIGMARTTKGMISAIRQAAYALEDDGAVTELMADGLDEAYTGLKKAEEELCEYRATKAEDSKRPIPEALSKFFKALDYEDDRRPQDRTEAAAWERQELQRLQELAEGKDE